MLTDNLSSAIIVMGISCWYPFLSYIRSRRFFCGLQAAGWRFVAGSYILGRLLEKQHQLPTQTYHCLAESGKNMRQRFLSRRYRDYMRSDQVAFSGKDWEMVCKRR